MKICMIGDSHLAMMVNADKASPSSARDLSAVSWPRQHEEEFALRGTELIAESAGLAEFWKNGGYSDRIDLAKFDKIVFVSHTVTMFNAFTILQDHVVSGWHGANAIVDAICAPNGQPNRRRLLTAAAFNECLAGIIKSNFAFRIASHLRQHSSVPMVVLPPPFLAEGTLTHRPKLMGLKRILQNNDGSAFARCYEDAHRIAFSTVNGLLVINQPPETVTQGCLTKEVYRTGATRFGTDVAHNDDDVMHAGPSMGRLLLDEIAAASRKAEARSASSRAE